MIVKGWLAASRRGQLIIFDNMPERSDAFGVWVGDTTSALQVFLLELESRGYELPQLTWQDKPLEITINIEW